jgi:hypothetical protein
MFAGSPASSSGLGGGVASPASASSSSSSGAGGVAAASGAGGAAAASSSASSSSGAGGATVVDAGAGAPCSPATDIPTGNKNTGNFGTTGPACYRTNDTINGWGCSNCDGRTITVDNVVVTVGQIPLPAPYTDGYTYFSFSAGTYTYASLYYY